ncbi:putative alpha/beta fold family hydrolase [Coniochaeta ligniaria NRRL 30616]|uniref:Putative alpha/beta fold family hydrolase n=1 Tax=Coniochaeta ligniaria NRRL 30616 TaxID=1408157 RepID=A0A1J7IG18_9PEZI|nr:putative alpha/beta fold family hydrolase [Coniochaeta ligniaria NRRL 30616]
MSTEVSAHPPGQAPTFTTRDGVEIYYKDWGNKTAPVVFFSHGWPLDSDNWENQMFFLSNAGYRTVAHDRRGHGRSSQPWFGNDMDTYASDLDQLFTHLKLTDGVMVGHSTGGGEVARFTSRYGGHGRVKKAALVSSVTPFLLQTPGNPAGTPLSVFDGFRAAMVQNRAQFFLDVPTGPFFGFNRPNATVSQGLIDSWWSQGMAAGFVNAYECIKAFSETDFTEDLKKMDIPVLVLHGSDDQIVPIQASALAAIKLLSQGTLKIIPGGPHALPNIYAAEVNSILLDFIKG